MSCVCSERTQVLPVLLAATPRTPTPRHETALVLSYLSAMIGALLLIVTTGAALVGPENLLRLVS